MDRKKVLAIVAAGAAGITAMICGGVVLYKKAHF